MAWIMVFAGLAILLLSDDGIRRVIQRIANIHRIAKKLSRKLPSREADNG